ncbi:MAG: hypothetical protein WC091_25790, partial [Sulfuricellaceae bacterium]
MVLNNFATYFAFARLVKTLRTGLHGFPGAWRRCNSLEWNDHSASLRLALHPENRTLQPVQRRFLVPCNIIYFALRKIDWQFTTSDTRIKLTLLISETIVVTLY